MPGLTFIHWGFLAGGLAAAVPIAIHLWFRPRPKPVAIGSLRFLKVVLREHSKRRNLRRWLLLMLRVAGVLLLALLFARPYLAGTAIEGADREVAILIDQSASMAMIASARSPFQRAQDAASSLIDALPARTVAHLAYFDDGGVDPVHPIAIDRKRGPGQGGTDYGLGLAWARDLMALSRKADRRVVLFTDLQRSGTDRAVLAVWPKGVGVGVAFEVVDVGKPVTNNLAVTGTDISRTDIDVRRGEPIEVSAVVANTGLFPARDVPVRLRLTGGGGTAPIQAERKVSLDGGARRVVRFPLDAVRPGSYQGSVEVVAADEFLLDNTRWLAFEARATDRVLLLDGAPGESVFSNETYYLETALRLALPGKDRKASATPYEPVRLAWPSGSGGRLPALSGYPVAIACNVAEWSAPDARAWRDFVVAGGRLVLFAGDRTGPASFEELRRAKVVPVEFVGVAEPGSYRFATWDKEGPLFRDLSDPQHGDLRRLEFRRMVRLKAEPGPGAKVLAASTSGDPILIEHTLGAGRVLIFAVAADRDWGDWPVQRLFLPIVHQMLGVLTGRLPDGNGARASASGPGRAHPPGVERDRTGVIVRNLEPSESDGERISVAEFRRVYRLPESDPGKRPGAEPLRPDPTAQRPDELGRWVVIGLFAVLVAETFVANRTRA